MKNYWLTQSAKTKAIGEINEMLKRFVGADAEPVGAYEPDQQANPQKYVCFHLASHPFMLPTFLRSVDKTTHNSAFWPVIHCTGFGLAARWCPEDGAVGFGEGQDDTRSAVLDDFDVLWIEGEMPGNRFDLCQRVFVAPNCVRSGRARDADAPIHRVAFERTVGLVVAPLQMLHGDVFAWEVVYGG